ncbi:CorA metal ion transporter [Puttea exsequens]|nr:CorA metal ion transporter [Puttea exsequens]
MASQGAPSGSNAPISQRPTEGLYNTQSTTDARAAGDLTAAGKKRRSHRAGKKKKSRRQSFLPTPGQENGGSSGQNRTETGESATTRPPFYRLGQSSGRNLSETSLDSNALLDHRDHQPMRQRRESRAVPMALGRGDQSNNDLSTPYRPAPSSRNISKDGQRRRYNHAHASSGDDSEADDVMATDRTPLMRSNSHTGASPTYRSGYGMFSAQGQHDRRGSHRRASTATSTSSKHRRRGPSRQSSHDVNNPPSVPNSPKLGPGDAYDDVTAPGAFGRSPENMCNDQVIDIDNDDVYANSAPPSPRDNPYDHRRHTIATGPEEDVCFPIEGMSTIGEEDFMNHDQASAEEPGTRRRRVKEWPDLSVLDEWSREEKEYRSEGIRAKQISEPVLVNGMLRPRKNGWHRTEEDAPYRFTYFNEEISSTIHSQTISELLQPGQRFRELFIPDPPELSDDSSDEEDIISVQGTADGKNGVSPQTQSRIGTRHSSIIGESRSQSHETSGEATPHSNANGPQEKAKRFGERPTFWLDVLSPTDAEMRVISKTFGIHPLTAEDIMMQEDREKVELFRHYYLVNYRSYEQDRNSEDYLDPVNMYVVVFREGVISFHFSMTPHPANVRRRIRQLNKSLVLSADWISYAIIDDITDVYQPIIQEIQEDVDDIDDSILALHDVNKYETEQQKMKEARQRANDEKSEAGGPVSPGSDMLRRVGEGRKTVMRVQRLLGNKADVIKGFAKRCNERWEIAPRSDIGLFLGDIQDHVVTMTSNLSHYETLLSRAHSNYLAQINIRMNERQEQTADVLGKLTVLGTIVLPMNIITGMWGMNVLVPGQDTDNLYWFWSITAGLLVFGFVCFFIAKRVYGIV